MLLRAAGMPAKPGMYSGTSAMVSTFKLEGRAANLAVHPTGASRGEKPCKSGASGPEDHIGGLPNLLWTPKMTYAEHLRIFTDELPLKEKARAQVLGETARRLWFPRL